MLNCSSSCRESVGYGVLLEAVTARLVGCTLPRRLLLSCMGLLLEVSLVPLMVPTAALTTQLSHIRGCSMSSCACNRLRACFAVQEVPGRSSRSRFTSSTIANPAALPLFLGLLRRAAGEEQLWGLAAFRELLLLGVHNLAAAEGVGLNAHIIGWLQEVAGDVMEADEGTAAVAVERGGAEEEGDAVVSAPQQLHLLRQQLLALLRLSGSYSTTGRLFGVGGGISIEIRAWQLGERSPDRLPLH